MLLSVVVVVVFAVGCCLWLWLLLLLLSFVLLFLLLFVVVECAAVAWQFIVCHGAHRVPHLLVAVVVVDYAAVVCCLS